MESRATKISQLLKYYQAYLESSDSARFISSVAQSYSLATLCTLVERGDTLHRRAASLALGFLGDNTCTDSLGKSLNDRDRRVRLVADDALRAVWSRNGSAAERNMLDAIVRHNECQDFARAIELATDLIDNSAAFAEVYNQRGIAHFHLKDFDRAMDDCRRVIELERFHYAAWIGLGHCLLEVADINGALDSFRMAISIYPDLEPVRMQILHLEKSLQ